MRNSRKGLKHACALVQIDAAHALKGFNKQLVDRSGEMSRIYCICHAFNFIMVNDVSFTVCSIKHMKRTRAIELLDQAKIAVEVREFSASEFTVEETAAALGLPLNELFKTLVAEGDRKGIVMAVIPGDSQLSLSKLAKAMGDKRAAMIDVEDLFRVTGYLKGGCSPLGARKRFPVYLDASALTHPRISVSAGLRGVQMLLAPDDLRHATSAVIADLLL